MINGKLRITEEKLLTQERSLKKLNNKIAVVTGGAQGFGAGIAEALFALNMNVVIADLNEETGKSFASLLSSGKTGNKAIFVRTDVSDSDSVQRDDNHNSKGIWRTRYYGKQCRYSKGWRT